MIKEMINMLKLIRYSYQLKANSICGIIITILGIIMLAFSTWNSSISASSFLLGSFYVVLGPMIIIQMLLLTLYANMVKASPKARMLELQLSDYLSGAIGICGYTIIIFFCIIMNILKNNIYPPIYLLITAALIAVLLVNNSISYKIFVTSMIGLGIAVGIIFAVLVIATETSLWGPFSLGMGSCCLLGYLIIFIGIGLSYLLRRGVYRLPFSKLAGGTKLRKEL